MTRLNPTSWIVWSGCAAAAALLTRNPWTSLLLAGTAAAVGWRRSGEPPGPTTRLLTAGVVLTSTVLNLFFSRAGETVLVELPIGWIGGPYTLEGLAFGVSAGLQVATVLLVTSVFSRAITAADLLRRTPRNLYPVGVAATLGLTFAPHARRSLADLQEARRLRGLPAPRWRDAPRLLTPMVVIALERAMAQAEALAARGWARSGSDSRGRATLAWAAIGAAVLLCAAAPDRAGLSLLLLVLILAGMWLVRQRGAAMAGATFDPWSREDAVVIGLAGAGLAVLLALTSQGGAGLAYYPYPIASWPALRPEPLAAVALLSAPAWMRHA